TLLVNFQIDPQTKIKSLSYGQRKKVNIAFALATNVSTLLMDEPTNGLDIPSKAQFRKIIAKHITDDKTIIISTHQIRDIHHLIDHLLVLQKQELVLDESIYSLSQKLKFQTGECANALYTESHINSVNNILWNTTAEDTPFDIELFFNAITTQPELLT